MILSAVLTLLLSSTQGAGALNIRQSSKGFATVDISKNTGTAKTIASGWIYGFPDNGVSVETKIPEHFTTDVKFVASRAGGAQIPARGWVSGLNDYIGRFNSTLSNYRTTRHYGGDFILLVHDLWGADGGSIKTFPGDNGDWSSTDAFFKRLAADLRANNMLDGLVIDLWNEPDIDIFWARSWDQFLQYYVRSHKFFRNEFKNTLISGPSAANIPTLNNAKWQAWLKTISTNNAIPNIYSWHQIGSWSKQPDQTLPDFNTLKAAYNLPDLPIDINEYAAKEEQNPANSVYYIAQLERHNMRGLRANWGSGSGLHDYLANLVYKNSNGVYYPNGEWHLYKYYAQMSGDRVATTASSDRAFDVFATKTGSQVKIIAGTRSIKAAYEVRVSGLQSLGLPAAGSVKVSVTRFDWAGDKGEVKGPVDVGVKTITYSSNTLSILVDPPTNATAFAYQINV